MRNVPCVLRGPIVAAVTLCSAALDSAEPLVLHLNVFRL